MDQAILADGVEATAGAQVYSNNGTAFTVESVTVSPISPAGRANVYVRKQLPGAPTMLADSLNLASSPSWWTGSKRSTSTLKYVAVVVGGAGLLGGLLWWLWPKKR